MKNILRAAAVAALIGAPVAGAFGQTHYVPHVWVGGHAGMTLSNISFAPKVPEKMATGVTAGVSFRYAEERHVGLLAEINIAQRGWEEDFEEASLKYKRTLTYVDLPVMTHIYFGGRKFKAFFNLGAEVAYMLSDGISADFDYRHPETVAGFPLSKRPVEQLSLPIKNRMDYGIVGGGGMEFRVNRRNAVMVECRYYFGLGNIFADSKRDAFSASRNGSIELTAAYLFRIK